MAQVFKVVFTGALAPAANADDVARDFASVFKVSEEQARALVGAGESRVLKSHVDEANAKRYLEVLEEIGLSARIEPVDGDEPRSAEANPAMVDAGVPAPLSDSAEMQPRAPIAPGDPSPSVSAQPVEPVGHPAAHGWRWIKLAWQQFKAQPRRWLAAVALIYLVSFVLSLVPVVGSLASMILGPVFAGGLMLGAQAQQRTGQLRAMTAFDGFSHRGGTLALVGLLYLCGLFLAFMIAGLLALATGVLTADSLEALSSTDPNVAATAFGPGLLLFVLIAMLSLVPLLMAYWFAPALVVLEGMGAVEAMLASFRACWKNMIPLLVYGLVLFFILVGASLVFGILAGLLSAISETLMVVAMLLVLPLMLVFAALVVLSIYTAYRDVFYADTPATGAFAF